MNKHIPCFLMIAGLFVVSTPAMAGTIYTTYVSSNFGGGVSALASVDPVTGVVTEIGSTGVRRVGALTYDSARGKLFGVGEDMFGDSVLIEINPLTGQSTQIGYLGAGINNSGAMAYHAELDTLFAVNFLGSSEGFGQLLSIDPNSGQATTVGVVQPQLASSFAYYPATGQLLFTAGFEEFGAPFGSWDPVTGVQTVIGPTATVGGMDYDPDVDVLYGINGGTSATGGLGDKLFAIDPMTGEATVLVTLDRAEFYSSLAVVPIPAPGALVIGAAAMWMRGSRRRR